MNIYLSNKITALNIFLIILVVYIHSYNLKNTEQFGINKTIIFIENLFSNGLCRTAVPIFFIISGYLFYNKTILNFWSDYFIKLKKRFYSIFLPYVFWNLISIAFVLIVLFTGKFDSFISKAYFEKNMLLEIFNLIFLTPVSYQLWFIRDLMILVIFSPLIFLCIKKFNVYFLSIIFLCYIIRNDLYLIASESLFYFALGCYVSLKNPLLFQKKIAYKVIVIIGLLWIIIITMKTFFLVNNYTSVNHLFLMQKAANILGVIFIWFFYDDIVRFSLINHYLQKISAYSFFIYLAHEPYMDYLQKVLIKVFKVDINLKLAILYLFLPILTILICICISTFMKRFLPKILSILVGWR